MNESYARMTPGQKAAYTRRLRAAGLATPSKATSKPTRRDPALVEIEAQAQALLVKHGLSEKGWRFRWDDLATVRAGVCKFGPKLICLSSRVFARPENQHDALNTILHEIAHALAGPGHHHDRYWRSIARSIGCSGDRCHTLEVGERKKMQKKYVVDDCPCGSDHGRFHPPKPGRYWCKRTKHTLVWRKV